MARILPFVQLTYMLQLIACVHQLELQCLCMFWYVDFRLTELTDTLDNRGIIEVNEQEYFTKFRKLLVS